MSDKQKASDCSIMQYVKYLTYCAGVEKRQFLHSPKLNSIKVFCWLWYGDTFTDQV